MSIGVAAQADGSKIPYPYLGHGMVFSVFGYPSPNVLTGQGEIVLWGIMHLKFEIAQLELSDRECYPTRGSYFTLGANKVSGEGGRGSPTYHLIILPPTASKQECMTIIQRKLDGENLSLAEK